MNFNIYVSNTIEYGKVRGLQGSWEKIKNPIGLFEELLKTDIDIFLKRPEGYWTIYVPYLDGHEEEVLDLLKDLRPELYYEIMLGIKQ